MTRFYADPTNGWATTDDDQIITRNDGAVATVATPAPAGIDGNPLPQVDFDTFAEIAPDEIVNEFTAIQKMVGEPLAFTKPQQSESE